MQSNPKARVFLGVFALIVIGLSLTAGGPNSKSQTVNCDVHAGPCSATLMGNKVSLDIGPKPVKAMQDLTFTLALANETKVDAPYIDLGMDGMNMGKNRVILRPFGGSVFQGKGVIVRCPSGRRTWKARVTVPKIGSVEFIFDVIY